MKKENKEIKENLERVAVHLRIRPFNKEEIQKDQSSPFEDINESSNSVCIRKDFDQKMFNYDTISNSNSSQGEIFDKTSKDIIDSVLNGYNGTILAYGQTGTGKTFTMVGDFENENYKGIIPRSFEYIFSVIEKNIDFNFTVSLAFLQIYLENIQDLIETSNNNIKIREDLENGVYLEGVQWINVKNKEECKQVFLTGEKNRTVGETKSNISSSRSHAILILRLEKKIPNNCSNKKNFDNNIVNSNYNKQKSNSSIIGLTNSNNGNSDIIVNKSQLFLVDLAGSERIKKSKAKAIRLEEAKKINASLLILGNCIQALSDKNSFIPYRDSKLTRILQESLGGNAKTGLIVTVSPSNYHVEETVCSLAFGQRAMKVQNKPILNKFVDYESFCKKLTGDLDKLNDEYLELKDKYEKLLEENNILKEKIKKLNLLVLTNRESKSLSFDDLDKSEKILINNENDENLTKEEKPNDNSETSSIKSESISSSDLQKIRDKYKNEIAKLEDFYEEILKNKISEYDKTLDELTEKLNQKEYESDQFKNDNIQIREKYNELVDIYHECEEEKSSYKHMLLELRSEYEEIKIKLEEKSNVKYQQDENIQNTEDNYFEKEIDSESERSIEHNKTIISRTLESKNTKVKVSNNTLSMSKFNKEMTQKISSKLLSLEINRKFKLEELRKEIIVEEEFLSNFKKPIFMNNSVQTANESFSEKTKDILIDKKISALKSNEKIGFDIVEHILEVLYENFYKNLETIKITNKEITELKEEQELLRADFDKNRKKLITEYNEKIAVYLKEINNLKNTMNDQENISKDKANKIENNLRNEIKIREEEISLLKKSNNTIRNELSLTLEKKDKLISEIEDKEKVILGFKRAEAENKKCKTQMQEIKKLVKKFGKDCDWIFGKNILKLKENDNLIACFNCELKKLEITYEKSKSLKNNMFKFEYERNKILNTVNENLQSIYSELIDLLKENEVVKSKNKINFAAVTGISTLNNKNFLGGNLTYLTFEENKILRDDFSNEHEDLSTINLNTINRNCFEKNKQINLNKYLILNSSNYNNSCYDETKKLCNNSNSIHLGYYHSDNDNIKSKSIPIKNKNFIHEISDNNSNDIHSKSTDKNKELCNNNNLINSNKDLHKQDFLNFQNIINAINNFFKLLNEYKKKLFILLVKVSQLLEFSMELTAIVKQKNELYTNETKTINIELELSKKSEYYLRNCFIVFLQNLLKEISVIIPIVAFEEIIFELNKNSKIMNEITAPELIDNSNKIIHMIKDKIGSILNDKDQEIKSLNERILFFLKETQNYKKIISSSKMQNYIFVKNSHTELINNKDNEINRLNEIINCLNEKMKREMHEKCFTESRINLIEFKDDLDKSHNNNLSINFSVDIKENNNTIINKTTQQENDTSEFLEFKNNISKYDNEIIELKRTLKDNKVKSKKEISRSNLKLTSNTFKNEENEVLKKSLYLKERLKKAVQKVEKKNK